MPADRIHFIRHGEVHNPQGILYGRLPNFALSERGVQMASMAAQDLLAQGRDIRAVFSSPLQRTRESAKPFKELFGLDALVDERLIEPHNIFEGKVLSASKILLQPGVWFHLRNPSTPSWGEPFLSIAQRMEAAAQDAFDSVPSGDVVLVSHQAPIAILHKLATGQKLVLKPRGRRCDLSSITSFERVDGKLVEVDYRDPARDLRDGAIDVGAV